MVGRSLSGRERMNAWAVLTKKGKVILESVRQTRGSCIDDFCEHEKFKSWEEAKKNGHSLAKVRVSIA